MEYYYDPNVWIMKTPREDGVHESKVVLGRDEGLHACLRAVAGFALAEGAKVELQHNTSTFLINGDLAVRPPELRTVTAEAVAQDLSQQSDAYTTPRFIENESRMQAALAAANAKPKNERGTATQIVHSVEYLDTNNTYYWPPETV